MRLGSFPIPFFLFALLLALAIVLFLDWSRSRHIPPLTVTVASLAVVWLGVRLIMLVGSGAPPPVLLALTGWYALPAIILAFAGRQPSGPGEITRRGAWGTVLDLGMIWVGLFAFVQLIFGVNETQIPGLTIAWGDTYESKTLTVFSPTGEFTKIPSTYHNGNILGVVAGFFLVTTIQRVLRSHNRKRYDILLIVLTTAMTLLAASRSVFLAVVIPVLFVLVTRGFAGRRILLFAAGIIITLAVLVAQPGLADRFSLESLFEPTGAGRTLYWEEVLGRHSVSQLLIGTSDWYRGSQILGAGLAEGVVGILQQVGVIGLVLIVTLAVAVTRPPWMREWRAPLLVLGIAAVIDSSYLVFPTLFLPFARMYAPGIDALPNPMSSARASPTLA
jgi:hypothetical protein